MIYFFALWISLFGLIIGSFLNCLIYRLHEEKSINGRSFCPKCKKQIAWYDNIPLLSFLILRGRCRHCGEKISWQYPLMESATALLFLLVFLVNPPIFNSQILIFNSFNFQILFTKLFITSVLVVIFLYDLKWYLILDIISLPASAIVLALNLWLGISWQSLLISAIIGSSFFLFQFIISRGKWIGGGDIRLGLFMGLALGWPMVLVAIFLAYFGGSIIAVGLLLFSKKKWDSQVPLGVFLTPATFVVMLWGQEILDWYLGLIML